MKRQLEELLRGALRSAVAAGELQVDLPERILLEEPADPNFGDVASNVAMVLAKEARRSPRALAETIVGHIADARGYLAAVDVAGPGFINLRTTPVFWRALLRQVLEEGARYGRRAPGSGGRVQVEFVSANPTGPLHIGHGRGAVIGDVVARLLEATGHEVEREYYVNDHGRQMELLGRSMLARVRELEGDAGAFPPDGYPGEYLIEVARRFRAEQGGLAPETTEAEAVEGCARFAGSVLLDDIRGDLARFEVRFDRFVSERALHADGRLEAALQVVPPRLLYQEETALMFRSTEFGDEKDRAIRRTGGAPTYFGGDIAHFHDTLSRGFDRLVNVLGADHHGYVARLRAAVAALGGNPDALHVVLVQLVNLTRGGQPVRMGKRAGEFVTLREVLDEVGSDAARVFFLLRRADSHLDFDLDLAKKQSTDNPVFYIQYAHARIASILRQAEAAGIRPSPAPSLEAIGEDEVEICRCLLRYPEVVSTAAQTLEPHRVIFYLLDLAGAFHRYYNRCRVLADDEGVTEARLALVQGVQTVLRSALDLVGVSAPESM